MQISGTGKNSMPMGSNPLSFWNEFYPTLTFSKTDKVTPILSAKVHIQTRNNKPVFEETSRRPYQVRGLLSGPMAAGRSHSQVATIC